MDASTEGRKLLLAVLQNTTQRAVADRIGVSQPAVASWVRGRGAKQPAYTARKALLAAYGIALDAWDYRPVSVGIAA